MLASVSPSYVTGNTTTLRTLGADAEGESQLTYTWATTGTPPAAVTFSDNGTNTAKNPPPRLFARAFTTSLSPLATPVD